MKLSKILRIIFMRVGCMQFHFTVLVNDERYIIDLKDKTVELMFVNRKQFTKSI